MSGDVKARHNGVEITYVEIFNRWEATVDDKRMTAISLGDLRKRIDTAQAPPKVKLAVPVYVNTRFDHRLVEATVTSPRYDDANEFNVSGVKDQKVFHRYKLYARNDRNLARIDRVREIDATVSKLEKERAALMAALELAELK